MMQMIFRTGLRHRSDSTRAESPALARTRKVERREIESLLADELSHLPPLAA